MNMITATTNDYTSLLTTLLFFRVSFLFQHSSTVPNFPVIRSSFVQILKLTVREVPLSAKQYPP